MHSRPRVVIVGGHLVDTGPDTMLVRSRRWLPCSGLLWNIPPMEYERNYDQTGGLSNEGLLSLCFPAHPRFAWDQATRSSRS